MGFIGSSGKGTKPIPISNSEYEKLLVGSIGYDGVVAQTLSNEPILLEVAPSYTTNLVPGMQVEISQGAFAGSSGIVKSIDLSKGTATVSIEFFGREQIVNIDLKFIKE
jgi:transcriptional antiterminator NusG